MKMKMKASKEEKYQVYRLDNQKTNQEKQRRLIWINAPTDLTRKKRMKLIKQKQK
jgi:hypothetical protein